jgi:hypothetical protein
MLADGRLHLTAIAKLGPHLTLENREALLKRAAHRSRREIEELVAELSPRPDAPAVMRKLPDRRARTTSPTLRLGPDAEVPLGLRPEGRASVDRQLRPDGVGRGRLRPGSHRSASPLGDPSLGADAAFVAVTSAGRGSVGLRRRVIPGHDRGTPGRLGQGPVIPGARTPTRPNVLGVTRQTQQERRCRRSAASFFPIRLSTHRFRGRAGILRLSGQHERTPCHPSSAGGSGGTSSSAAPTCPLRSSRCECRVFWAARGRSPALPERGSCRC